MSNYVLKIIQRLLSEAEKKCYHKIGL